MKRQSKSQQNQIQFSDRTIDYTLKLSKQATRRRITVSDKGITVVLPAKDHPQAATALLQEHASWVLKQVEKLQARQESHKLSGDTLLFRGVETRLRVVESPHLGKTFRVDERPGELVFHLPDTPGVDRQGTLESWFRQQAKIALLPLVAKYSEAMTLQPKKIFVKDHRSKWGSCSTAKNLNFNWKLIFAPPRVMEYVVVHELAHLQEMNHSERFWAIVESHCPEFATHRTWLKEYGWRLRLPELC